MEFGSVETLAGADLSLPKDDPENAAVLAAAPQGAPAARVYVGCPIWNDATLARKISPPGKAAKDRLVPYVKAFNSVELNASGYGLSQAQAARWGEAAGEGFRFCPKVPRDISHGRNLDDTYEAYDRFVASARAFGSRLGTAFLQFPESFGPSRFPELERFLRSQGGKLDLAVEVRHQAWFNEAGRREALFALLQELKLCAVITDVPGRRDLLHQRLTSPTAFIRFSGHDLSPPDLRRIDDWAARLKGWMRQGLQTLYFFPHHEPKHFSADWSALFLEVLNKTCGTHLPVPKIEAPKNKKAPGEAQGNLMV
jgi:uncharacterized protein YecE (DUF72 family)